MNKHIECVIYKYKFFTLIVKRLSFLTIYIQLHLISKVEQVVFFPDPPALSSGGSKIFGIQCQKPDIFPTNFALLDKT